MCFQLGEGPSMGLFRARKLREGSLAALLLTLLVTPGGGGGGGNSTVVE